MMKPLTIDLTIPLDGLDTNALLADWLWRVPNDFVPVQLNKFGWWFFRDPQGRVHLLDLLEGNLAQIATSIQEFNALKNTDEAHSDWYQDGFVFRCHAEGLHLQPGQCYIWKIPPILGGKLEFENIQVISLRVCQTLMGQILRQIEERGPNARISEIRIVED